MRVLFAVVCVSAVVGILAAAPPAPDPWAKVPKSPTACYSSQDKYNDEVGAAIDAINQDTYRQEEINRQLTERLNNQDGMEQANRMQAYMMENPEEFAKLMAYTQTGLPEAQAEAATEAEREEALRAELKGLQARYEAELERVLGPLHAKYKSLGISESGTPPAVWAEGLAIMKQMNAAYEKACPGWWGASGQFDGWLQKYKAHLVQNRIPHREGGEAMKATQFKIMGIPAETFKPTVALEAVALYLKEARDIFDSRKTQPLTEGLIQ